MTHGAGRLAAKRATTIIPIVFGISGDPVAEGLVSSVARPGGNITGLSYFGPELAAKKLELLKEAAPRITRVAVLANWDNPANRPALEAMESAARALKVGLHPVGVRKPDDVAGAFRGIAASRADALWVSADAVITSNMTRIADLALQQRLPSVGFTEWPEGGGLMTYDVDVPPMFRRAATFVDKILRGTKPADLPVEQAMQFELILNMKTARTLGITFPQSILLRATRAIE